MVTRAGQVREVEFKYLQVIGSSIASHTHVLHYLEPNQTFLTSYSYKYICLYWNLTVITKMTAAQYVHCSIIIVPMPVEQVGVGGGY